LHELSQASVFIYRSRGKWAFSPVLWSFPPTATFTSFPAPGCWACAATPAFSSGLVIYNSMRYFPTSSPLALKVPHPLCYVSFFCCNCLLFSFLLLFFLCGGLVSPGGYADLAQGCLSMPRSSPCGLHLPKLSGHGCLVARGALLVSLFKMEWRCSVQAGVVEESKFCLFSVVFPVRCISSVSPRFYFRRHTFCFLPLAAIFSIYFSITLKVMICVLQ
jgi:hypothetical protein